MIFNGPTLPVQIGFDLSWRSAGGGVPNLPSDHHKALVDTGATLSCIDAALATKLKLPTIDHRYVSGVGGRTLVPMYLAHIYVVPLRQIIYGAFAGVYLSDGGQIHNALLGRSFLRSFVMKYDGRSGVVTFD